MRKTAILSPTSFSASFGFHIPDGRDIIEKNIVQRNKVYRFLNPEGKVVKYTHLEKSAPTPKKSAREKSNVPELKSIAEKVQSNNAVISPEELHVKSNKIVLPRPINIPKKSLKLVPTKKVIESRIEINNRILNTAKLTKRLIKRKTNNYKKKDFPNGSNSIKFQQKSSNEQSKVSTGSLSKSFETLNNSKKSLRGVTPLQPSKVTAKTNSSTKEFLHKGQSFPTITDVPLNTNPTLVDVSLLGKPEKIDLQPENEASASNLETINNVDPTLSGCTKEAGNQTTSHYCIRHKSAALVLESAYLTYKKKQDAKLQRSANASKIDSGEKPVNNEKKEDTFLVIGNKVMLKSVAGNNHEKLYNPEEIAICGKDNTDPRGSYSNAIPEKEVLINILPNFSLTYPFNIFSVLRHKLQLKYPVSEAINNFDNQLHIPKIDILTNSTETSNKMNSFKNNIAHQIHKGETMNEIEMLTLHHPYNIMSAFKAKMLSENLIDNLSEVKCDLKTEIGSLNIITPGDEEIKMKLDVIPENNCTLVSWDNTTSSNSNYETQLMQARKLKKRLRKPSDTVKKLLRSDDLSYKPQNFLSGQFYKELNFLDSFIELLQRIDSTSINNIEENSKGALTEKCTNDDFYLVDSSSELQFSKSINNELQLGGDYNVQDLIIKNNSVSKKESLRLLNILIQDESRRAKNLILIIKMREKSLKDFTKSHILWLESQKKKYNGDTSVLKKKQRGSLMKLEQECDEMNRMKKTLVSKCEQRKTALKQIKRNLQLMITNEESDNEKKDDRKKIKNNNQRQHLPRSSPMKCFDVSGESASSDIHPEIMGSEKPGTLKNKTVLNMTDAINQNIIREPFATQNIAGRQLLTERIDKIEKGIQTSNSPFPTNDFETSVAEPFRENCNVTGFDLNALFKSVIGNTCEIFNNEQHYEVKFNELQNILRPLFSKNDKFLQKEKSFSDSIENSENITDEFEKKSSSKFIKSDSSESSTNSTARSLIEELNNYFSNDCQNEKEDNKISIIESDTQNLQLQQEMQKQQESNEIKHSITQNNDIDISLPIKNGNAHAQDKIQYDSKTDTSFKNSVSTTESIQELISLEDEFNNGDVSEYSVEPDQRSVMDTEPRTKVINDLELPEGQDVSQMEDISVEILDDSKDVESKVITYSGESFEENTSPPGLYHNINREISDRAQITSAKADNEGHQDLWVCTSNVTSPSPEQTPQGSPTGEYSPAAAAALRVNLPLPTLSEAEELRRKQLAIEMEIKALEKQQSQLSYCIVREIPDKPPPPYTPPATMSSAPGSNTTFTLSTSFPKDMAVVVEVATHYFDLLYGHIEKTVTKGSENKLDNISIQFNSEFDEFMFDLCKSTLKDKIRKQSSPNMPSTVKCLRQEKEVLQRDTLLELVMTEIKHVMGFKKAPNVEKAIQWIPMRGDHIDDILRQEFKKKDSEWTSLENEEVDVKEKLVDDILKMLINESVDDFLKICQKE